MICGKCKYPGWFGPCEWCRHPDHLEPIVPGRQLAIEAAGGSCTNFLLWETRVMPGSEPSWPMPVDVWGLFAPNGCENSEKDAENDAA
jgi:hypothetical protein